MKRGCQEEEEKRNKISKYKSIDNFLSKKMKRGKIKRRKRKGTKFPWISFARESIDNESPIFPSVINDYIPRQSISYQNTNRSISLYRKKWKEGVNRRKRKGTKFPRISFARESIDNESSIFHYSFRLFHYKPRQSISYRNTNRSISFYRKKWKEGVNKRKRKGTKFPRISFARESIDNESPIFPSVINDYIPQQSISYQNTNRSISLYRKK